MNRKDPGMSLSSVASGKRVRLMTVDASRGLRARLAAMGLVPGVEIEVVRNTGRGPFVVAVKGSRVMLGRGMVQKVIVE